MQMLQPLHVRLTGNRLAGMTVAVVLQAGPHGGVGCCIVLFAAFMQTNNTLAWQEHTSGSNQHGSQQQQQSGRASGSSRSRNDPDLCIIAFYLRMLTLTCCVSVDVLMSFYPGNTPEGHGHTSSHPNQPPRQRYCH